jgi:lipid II:glycine glycyltransferase (peptidoglycan interpeptide bridge formation enzyme)
VVRFWIFKEDVQIGCTLCIKIRAKRGNYIFIPHWPLVVDTEDFYSVFQDIMPELISLWKSEWFDFIRCNSSQVNTKINQKNFSKLWFRDAPMHENVEDTHLLDITVSEEKLLWNMKKWDRYYINRAIKEGVTIEISNSEEQKEVLTTMHLDHSKRQNGKATYSGFSKKFIDSIYKNCWDNITTISASHEGVVESVLMTIRFWKVCVYYIAASDIKHPKFSPNYLCQWEAIKKAKADWCSVYNFWWVSPDDNPDHPIAGVTKFKRKFSGSDYSLLHAQDYVLSKKYWFNYLIETLRRKKRWYYYKKPL